MGAFGEVDEFGRPVVKDSHQLAQAQKEKNAKLKAAFGLSEGFVDGSSFERNRIAKEKADEELKATIDEEKSKEQKKKKKKRSVTPKADQNDRNGRKIKSQSRHGDDSSE